MCSCVLFRLSSLTLNKTSINPCKSEQLHTFHSSADIFLCILLISAGSALSPNPLSQLYHHVSFLTAIMKSVCLLPPSHIRLALFYMFITQREAIFSLNSASQLLTHIILIVNISFKCYFLNTLVNLPVKSSN